METNIPIETESAATSADTAEQVAPEQMIIGMRRPIFRFYVRVLIIGAPIALAVGTLSGWVSTFIK